MASNNLFDQMQLRGFVDGWARLAIERWRKELRKMNIGVTDDLYKSFTHQLQRNKEELLGVLLKFNFYGRLRDMNVGRGLKAYERNTNKQAANAAKRYGANVSYVGRKEKRWFNKPKMAQIYRLRELLSDRMNNVVTSSITDIINKQSTFKIDIHG